MATLPVGVMRLIDRAGAHVVSRRGGGRQRLALDDAHRVPDGLGANPLALDEALPPLARAWLFAELRRRAL